MKENSCEGCQFVEQDGIYENCTAGFSCENQRLSEREEDMISDGGW